MPNKEKIKQVREAIELQEGQLLNYLTLGDIETIKQALTAYAEQLEKELEYKPLTYNQLASMFNSDTGRRASETPRKELYRWAKECPLLEELEDGCGEEFIRKEQDNG